MNQLGLMSEITKKMAETFQNIHQMCLLKIKELQSNAVFIKEELSEKNSELNQQLNTRVKKQKYKDPKKPKIPMTSFLRFCHDQREIILKDMPNQPHTQITKIASKCWKELSEAEKQPYHQKYLIEKQKYDVEMEKYLRENPEMAKQKKEKKNEKKTNKESKPNELKIQETPKPPQATQNQKQQSIERFFNNPLDDSFDHKI